MARSIRKTPCCGITVATSDASWKAKASRAFRRAAHVAVRKGADPPSPRAVVNSYTAPKDGKMWFREEMHPELMRK